jgi:hypothetical protein
MNIARGVLISFLLLISGFSRAEESEAQIQKDCEVGYAIGVAEAKTEIESNQMTYYTFGLVIPPTEGEAPRQRYGLPIKHIGSVIGPKESCVVHGHNETIEKHLGVAQ